MVGWPEAFYIIEELKKEIKNLSDKIDILQETVNQLENNN